MDFCTESGLVVGISAYFSASSGLQLAIHSAPSLSETHGILFHALVILYYLQETVYRLLSFDKHFNIFVLHLQST
jgi:hypothetical protein